MSSGYAPAGTGSVSVVIPYYNYGHFLLEAISSALDDQPGSDVRILVIDDASTDNSAEVARAIAAADARVQVAEHPTNRGHIATYNKGLLEWADGDYTVLLSADDRLAPGALRRAAELLDTHPNVGFAYGNRCGSPQARPPGPPRPRGRRYAAGQSGPATGGLSGESEYRRTAAGPDPRRADYGDVVLNTTSTQ